MSWEGKADDAAAPLAGRPDECVLARGGSSVARVRLAGGGWHKLEPMRKIKTLLKYLLAAFFVAAGLNHFASTGFYLRLMPPYLPWHLFFVYLSGFFQIFFGALLLLRRFTRRAAWALVALLVAVFPANVHMATRPDLFPEFRPAALWLRLPLQLVLVAWAYWFTRPPRTGEGGVPPRGAPRRAAGAAE